MKEQFAPDFIGIGMPRSGTTWLSRCLEEHPDICFSKTKEIRYFDVSHQYEKGISFYESFFDCDGEKVRGEFSTTYFKEKRTLERIKETYPNVKVLISLRNPYDRAFSHYLYRKRKSGKPKSFSELFENDPKMVIAISMYSKYLEMVFEVFDPKQVLVLIFDEYKIDAERYIQNVYRFLGVDETYVPTVLRREINKSKNLRYWFPPFEWLIAYRWQLKEYAVGRFLVNVLKVLGINKVIVCLRGVNKKPDRAEDDEVLSLEDRKRLDEVYLPDIAALEKILGRDLSLWRST